jgi:hypothetical protein
MSAEALDAALEATRIWEQPFQVHITGGEPFLNAGLLRRAVRTTVARGIPCYVETNAGWCVREDLVAERFLALRECGIRAILISCSPFHAASIPPRRTLLAIAVALEIFGPEGVIVHLPEWLEQLRRFGLEAPTPIERYCESYGSRTAGVMFWEGYGLNSGGRAGYRLGHLITRRRALAFRQENCRAEILYAPHSHFDLYGNFIPGFCGGLAAGAWTELAGLVEDFQQSRYPPLIDILVHSGPFGLYQFACQEYGYHPLARGYAGKCHLCVDVRSHLVLSGDFPELAPAGFYQRGLRAEELPLGG